MPSKALGLRIGWCLSLCSNVFATSFTHRRPSSEAAPEPPSFGLQPRDVGVPIPPEFAPTPRIDVDPFGELELLDPTNVVALISEYINKIWRRGADEVWHGTHFLCTEESYCLSVYLSTPFYLSMVAWMVVQHLDAIFAINPNDEALQWRVGEEQFSNSETGELLAEVSTALLEPKLNHTGDKIEEVTDLSKPPFDVALPPPVATSIKRLTQPVGIRSLFLHFLVALKLFFWPHRSNTPLESVYPTGTSIRTPTTVSAKGLATFMEISFIGSRSVSLPYTLDEVEMGLRELMDKIYNVYQFAIKGFIRRMGDENFVTVEIKTDPMRIS